MKMFFTNITVKEKYTKTTDFHLRSTLIPIVYIIFKNKIDLY